MKVSAEVLVVAVVVSLFGGYVFGRVQGFDAGGRQAFGMAAEGLRQTRAHDPVCQKERDGGDWGMRCTTDGTNIVCHECLGPWSARPVDVARVPK